MTLRSEDYTEWATVQKNNAVQKLRPPPGAPTAVYSPSEDSEGRVVAGKGTAKCLPGKIPKAVAHPGENPASKVVEWVVVRYSPVRDPVRRYPTSVVGAS